MKIKFGVTAFVAMFAMLSFKSESAHAIKKSFDIYRKDVNGKVHHIHGWIEFSLFPPSIDHGDIWYDKDHIVFSAQAPNPKEVKDYEIDGAESYVNVEELYSIQKDQIPPAGAPQQQQ